MEDVELVTVLLPLASDDAEHGLRVLVAADSRFRIAGEATTALIVKAQQLRPKPPPASPPPPQP